MGWRNLDLECATAADEMVEGQRKRHTSRQEMESLVTNAASVLAENGPYALFLFLWSRQSKESGELSLAVMQSLYSGLNDMLAWNVPAKDAAILPKVAAATAEFNTLVLVRRVLMQMLAYARYHAKSLPGAEELDKKRKAAKV